MTIAPLLPLPWIVLLVGGALGVTWIWMRRPMWAMVMRVVAVVLMGIVLLNPVREAASGEEAEERAVWLIADDSASMGTVDEAAQDSRFVRVVKEFDKWRNKDKAMWWWIGESVRPGEGKMVRELNADGRCSRLIAGMRELVDQAPVGTTMVLASDGHDTSDRGSDVNAWRELAEEAAGKGVRIDTWCVGGTSDADEAKWKTHVTLTGSPARAFEGETVTMTAVVERRGKLDAGWVTVVLVKDGREAQRATMRWREGERVARVTFTDAVFAKNKAAWAVYGVDGETAGEARSAGRLKPSGLGSDQWLVCNRGRRLRVLMLVGEPGMESRMMLDALRREEHLALTVEQAITDQRVSVARYGETEEDGPVGKVESLAELMGFDAVIVGARAKSLVEAEWLDAFVKAHHGGLARIGGDDWKRWFGPGATAESRAAYRGQVMERVMAAAGDEASDRAISVSAEPVNATAGQRVTVRVSSRVGAVDASGVVKVDGAAPGTPEKVAMVRDAEDAMRMSGEFRADRAGLMRVRYEGKDGTAETAVWVRGEDAERRDTTAWPEGLRVLAEGTGGRGRESGDVRAATFDTRSQIADRGSQIEDHPEPVLLRGWVMGVIVVLLGGAWIVRRRSGER
ncbi:MAG: hypothetical protein ACYC26_11140 [Phycisphaerales bacterium]